MRLINTKTLEMREFNGNIQKPDFPPYAILSHRWRDDEIDLQDFDNGRRRASSGYRKVIECCRFARSRRFDWVWVDTCCIDKRSSAELSEAINSMFKWYAYSGECHVYLDDIAAQDHQPLDKYLKSCTWLHRGWTLQELVAPNTVIFLDVGWHILGRKWRGMLQLAHTVYDPDLLHVNPESNPEMYRESKRDTYSPAQMLTALVFTTSIPAEVLNRKELLSRQSVAVKMSWMSERETTRAEDQAYCLLGLFNINMPLLYGEGHKAFERLQGEILRQSSDESIFAWKNVRGDHQLLAPSPDFFSRSGAVRRMKYYDRIPYSMTNQGLRFEYLPGEGAHEVAGVAGKRQEVTPPAVLIVLNCWDGSNESACLYLEAASCGHYVRRDLNGVQRSGFADSLLSAIKSEMHLWRSSPKGSKELNHRQTDRRRKRGRDGRSSSRTRVIYIHVGEEHHAACEVSGALGAEPEMEMMQDISDPETEPDGRPSVRI